MTYQVIVEPIAGGRYRARCDAGPEGRLSAEAGSAEAAVANLEKEIRYRLELCPCSRPAREYLRLEVRHLGAGPAG